MKGFTLIFLLATTCGALADTLTIPAGHTEVVRMSRAARTVAIGNPEVADVIIANENTIIVTGKANGLTNLIMLDESGTEIFRKQLQVDSSALTVRLYRGTGGPTESVCNPSACSELQRSAGETRKGTVRQTEKQASGIVETKEVVTAPPPQ